MECKITRNLLLKLTILLRLFLMNYCYTGVASFLPSHSVLVTVTAAPHVPYSIVNVTLISSTPVIQKNSFHAKISVVSSVVSGARSSTYHIPNSKRPKHQNSSVLIQPTSMRNIVHTTFVLSKPSSSQSEFSTTLATPSVATLIMTTPTPTMKHEDKPLLHKVGVIVGVVLGMVILCVCLIVFHKKEARLKCLKLLCRPCTKNYSRYNIVPIYVYDDNEQDIRELQDDSDLPLV